MRILRNALSYARAARRKPEVGTTPSDIVLRENKMALRRYRPTAPQRFARPILLIPSLINRHYILDLDRERSFVHYLASAGHAVYCIDWGTPGPEDGRVSFDDVCAGLIGRANRFVARQSESGDAHLLGYCLGGTLATIYAAAFPARVASLTALATPIDFDKAGIMTGWVRTPSFDLAALGAAYPNVPWRLMHAAFKLLRPTMPFAKWVAILENGADPEWRAGVLALDRWSTDNVSFPGGAYQTVIDALYRRNELFRGSFRLAGEPARLNRIECPLHVVCFDGDNIVPAESAVALAEEAGSRDVVVWRKPGSHVGKVVSLSAKDDLWPAMSEFWASRDCRRPRQAAAPVATRVAV